MDLNIEKQIHITITDHIHGTIYSVKENTYIYGSLASDFYSVNHVVPIWYSLSPYTIYSTPLLQCKPSRDGWMDGWMDPSLLKLPRVRKILNRHGMNIYQLVHQLFFLFSFPLQIQFQFIILFIFNNCFSCLFYLLKFNQHFIYHQLCYTIPPIIKFKFKETCLTYK